MGGYQALTAARPVMQRSRPETPVVNRDLIFGKASVPAKKEFEPVRVVEAGILLPRPVHPRDFEIGRINMRYLMEICVEASNISEVQILSPRRDQKLVKARWIFMWLAKHFTSQSYPQIGRRLGNRDHTTIMYGVRQAQRMIDHYSLMLDPDPRIVAQRMWSANWTAVPK